MQYVTRVVYRMKALCNIQNPNVLLHTQHIKQGITGSPTKFSATNELIPQILRITWTHISIPAINGAYFKNIMLSL